MDGQTRTETRPAEAGTANPQPSITRMVIFVDENKIEYPAVVCAVHGTACVSLNVFTLSGPQVRKSITHADRYPTVGYPALSWHWPERK